MPYRDDVVYRSEVLEIRWERPDADAPRVLVIEHDTGEAGLPEQRRLPERYGLSMIGGLLGLLGLGALLAHRAFHRVEPVHTSVRFGPERLRRRRGAATQEVWATPGVQYFGVGRDADLRTVFVTVADQRELLLEGLPPEDADRAVEALEEARAALG